MALFDVGLVNGKDGKDGKSAYQYAVDSGYKGTEDEFASTLADVGVVLTSTLPSGETTLTFTDEKITSDSILNAVYVSIFGVGVKSAEVSEGSITLEFIPQDEDMDVEIMIDAGLSDNDDTAQSQIFEHLKATDPHNIEEGLVNKQVAEEVATDDKVLVVVDGEIKKTNVENIGVREIESSTTITTTTVLKDGWEAMTGLDTAKGYYGVTYGDSKYVCVGASGSSYYSADGVNWVAMTGLNTSCNYIGVTYGNGRFVCVGSSGSSYYSTDGLTWKVMSGLSTSYAYTSITYGNGRFVCVGNSGAMAYSLNGTTWTAMSGLDTSKSYSSVTYGKDRFIVVGQGGSSYYSTDGQNWTAMTGLDTSKNYCEVTYGNDRFICISNSSLSYYSTDGQTWRAMTGLANYNHFAVAYGDGRFVCVGGNGSSYYSTDGETWVTMSGLGTSLVIENMTYGTEFVCVGASGSSYRRVYEVETKTDNLHSTLQVAGTLLLTKLYTGETTVTIEDASITQDSTFDVYADKYGVNIKNVTVDSGVVTIEFEEQDSDVNVKVVCK